MSYMKNCSIIQANNSILRSILRLRENDNEEENNDSFEFFTVGVRGD